jgi:uncharacterized membrane protein
MNKQQFLFTLSQSLKPLGSAAIQDILADFDDHFRNGLDAGRTEEEIADELGNPAEIARQYLDESADILTAAPPDIANVKPMVAQPVPQIAQPAYMPQPGQMLQPGQLPQPGQMPQPGQAAQMHQTVQTNQAMPSHDGTLIAVILLNIFIGVPIWIALFATLSGFWAAAAGIGITACVLFALAIFETGITSLILVLFGLAQTALTILAIILMVYLTKWLINGLRAYVRWNRKLVRGGESA